MGKKVKGAQPGGHLVACPWAGAYSAANTGLGVNKDDAEENLVVLVDERLDVT